MREGVRTWPFPLPPQRPTPAMGCAEAVAVRLRAEVLCLGVSLNSRRPAVSFWVSPMRMLRVACAFVRVRGGRRGRGGASSGLGTKTLRSKVAYRVRGLARPSPSPLAAGDVPRARGLWLKKNHGY